MKSRYRSGSSQNAGTLDSFRRQMADFARAERLRELRQSHPDHPSRERVAADIGVSTKTVYAWETGKGIHWKNAKRIAAYYGVDPETLVARDDRETPDLLGETQLDRIESRVEEILKVVSEPDEDAGLDDFDAELDRQESAPDEEDEDEPETG